MDLDGTLVLDNTFWIFLRTMWRLSGWVPRFGMFVSLARRTIQPGFDRLAMKEGILRSFGKLSADMLERIADETARQAMLTQSTLVVREVDAEKLRGARWVVATAAPGVYAAKIAESLSADDCIASAIPTAAKWQECFGENKLRACSAWLAERGLADAEVVVITDHADDLPLMRIADRVVVQNSQSRFGEIAVQLEAGQTLVHLDPTDAQSGGGIWLWMDGSAHGPNDAWEVETILSKHRYALMFAEPGEWVRVRLGDDLRRARVRLDLPSLPSVKARAFVHLRRRVVRDFLRIFH